MKVIHGLSAIGTRIDHDAIARLQAFRPGYIARREQQMPQQSLIIICSLAYGSHGPARNHEDMYRRLRSNVPECHAQAVLVHNRGRDFPVYDPLEERLGGHDTRALLRAEQSPERIVPAAPRLRSTPMATVYVTRRATFNAAHRLHNEAKSQAWNEATFGKCNNANWHGHNYVLEVTVAGEPAPETGYVIDLAILGRIIQDRIIDKVDHKNLNLDVKFTRELLPSTENLVVAFWRELEPYIPSGRLHRIRLQETDRNWAEYLGP